MLSSCNLPASAAQVARTAGAQFLGTIFVVGGGGFV